MNYFQNKAKNITIQVDSNKENLELLIYSYFMNHFEDIFYDHLEMHELNPKKAVSIWRDSIILTGDNGRMELTRIELHAI